ncbi:MAG: hypothetical protein EU542_05950 [Promethearchaeota archaeon]|jgi:hypothetical protein|nr:MAG: hypothetical protein EU542_05950 [Candidatus Lokiarchaeota archaeon]
MTEKQIWSYQLDWLNIISILGLDSINQIPEYKKDKAIKKLSKTYGDEVLLTLKPDELDELVANELSDLMKKELALHERQQEKMQRELKNRLGSLKKGGMIPINLNDFKDLDPDVDLEELIKYFSKKFMGEDDDKDKDDDYDPYDEDKSGYYI